MASSKMAAFLIFNNWHFWITECSILPVHCNADHCNDDFDADDDDDAEDDDDGADDDDVIFFYETCTVEAPEATRPPRKESKVVLIKKN